MDVDDGNLQVIDVEMIVENCPITIPMVYPKNTRVLAHPLD